MQCIKTFVEASDAMVFRTVPIVCNALEHLSRLLMLWFFRTVPICMQCIRTFVEASDAKVFRTVPIVCNALEHLWRLLMLWFLGLYLLYAMH